MSKSSQASNSLAFVDVITNSLGGMLVLFFIVVLLQTQLEWKETYHTPASQGGRKPAPFVLIVTTKDGRPVFNPGGTETVWQLSGMPAGLVSSRRGVNCDWGASHALLVVDHSPGLNAHASLTTPNQPTTFIVELYPAGAPKKTYEVETLPGSNMTEVWPALQSR